MSDDYSSSIFTGDTGLKQVHAGCTAYWDFQVSSGAKSIFSIVVEASDPDNAPEWSVSLYDSTNAEIWSNFRSGSEINVDFVGNQAKIFRLEVICPSGARYDDSVDISISVRGGANGRQVFTAVAKQSILVLKTQIDHEKDVVTGLISKAALGEKDVYAILSPVNMRGYVFVEGMDTDRLREKTREIKKARQFVDGETTIDEISHYLVPVSAVVGIEEGDTVELVDGPFKGEKARVQKIDPDKEDITVELIDAMVPIPVTVKGDSVRVIEKEN